MILIPEMEIYMLEVQAALPAIKKSKLVLDESEIVKYISDFTQNDNQIQLCIIPDARTQGDNEDNLMLVNSCGFMFLEKTDYSRGSKEWQEIFVRTQATAVAFMRKLVADKTYGSCYFHRYLAVGNINIEPIMGISSCNGWEVQCFFDIPF